MRKKNIAIEVDEKGRISHVKRKNVTVHVDTVNVVLRSVSKMYDLSGKQRVLKPKRATISNAWEGVGISMNQAIESYNDQDRNRI